ncbi:DotU family type IV/VI secretion system protein (plasmid) [Hafnia alvei]|uniref:DotU family type IV/VI secretion system protein n=1 Tax=Hafnia alvei TaxID=569 RepID=UPI000B6DC5FB|nr:DotU family type IV/VI secretion system protein [Hafnia alvei]MBI0278595.1 DotU family type IV/VI secretion system protein [Hafnia alvei]PNL03890.1 DotU family type IV/VI secretion system protein [Hafnia alvei]
MMGLLNCYLPIFRFITDFFLHPQNYADYEVFREKCIGLLQHSLLESELNHTQHECENAYFAVVLWIDERILCSSAPWVKSWRSELLQSQLFKISVGGEEFFTRLDTIDITNIPLRIVYLFCLLMGFHGKYTGQDVQLLQQRIHDERQCLPEDWQQWPNDAQLVEQQVNYAEGEYRKHKALLQRTGLLLALPLCLYLLVLLAGFGIFTR